MATFFDYIHWRGDLTFRQSAFNIVDSLIFSRLSYLPFDDLIDGTPTPLHKIAKQFFDIKRHLEPTIIMEEDVRLLQELMVARRYKNLKLHHYSHIFDESVEQQFAAFMIRLDYRTTYVVFRGTDMSLVGWKEDFNMTFKDTVPAQQSAVDYIKQYEDVLSERVYFGGHSKGGNLAMYSATFAPESVQQKIIEIHNFDGPGFNKQLDYSKKAIMLKDKTKLFVPQSSIVGILLNQDTQRFVVKSTGVAAMQHDTYTWLIDRCDFEYLDHTDDTSQRLEQTLHKLVNETPQEELQHIVDTLFSIVSSAQVKDIRDISTQKIMTIIRSYSHLSKDDTSVINTFFQEFIKMMLPNPLKK